MTVIIVLLPYAFYYYEDSKLGEFSVESFELGASGDNASASDIVELMRTGNVIWINDDISSDDELSDVSGIYDMIEKALNGLYKGYLGENEYIKNAIDTFLNDGGDAYSDSRILLIESATASGSVDGKPVSVPLLYIEFSGSGYECAEVLINRKTEQIYEFSISGSEKPLYPDENYDSDDIYNFANARLSEYWQCYNNVRGADVIDEYNFAFYLFDLPYTYLRYNTAESEYGEAIYSS